MDAVEKMALRVFRALQEADTAVARSWHRVQRLETEASVERIRYNRALEAGAIMAKVWDSLDEEVQNRIMELTKP